MSRLHLFTLLAFLLNFTSALVNNEELTEQINDIELKFYANGTIDEKVVELGANSVVRILSVDLPIYAQFSVVQAHSQIRRISLGQEELAEFGNYVNGNSVGIFVDLRQKKHRVMAYLFNPNPVNTTVLVFMITYDRTAPVPGGCNSKFEIKETPWLWVSYSENIVSVEHQPASLPSSKSSGCRSNSLNYDVYHYYLTRRDFTQESFFKAIRQLRTVKGAQENGKKIQSYGFVPATLSLFNMFPGVGRVFAVTVTYEGQSSHSFVSAYVPSFTYGCRLDVEGDCQSLSSSVGHLFCIFGMLIGLFLAFAGHHYFQIQMALVGSATLYAIAYISLVKKLESDMTGLEAGTIVMALLGGAAWWFMWWYWKIPALSVFPVSLMFGFLLSAILFSLPISYETLYKDVNFWAAFASCSAALSFGFFCFPRQGNIVSCSVLGSYAVIIPIDYYTGGILKYSVLNIVRRITVPNFGYAVLDAPFQHEDIILIVVWIGLAVIGSLVQFYRERGFPSFTASRVDWPVWPWCSNATQPLPEQRVHGPLSEEEPLISDSASAGQSYGSS